MYCIFKNQSDIYIAENSWVSLMSYFPCALILSNTFYALSGGEYGISANIVSNWSVKKVLFSIFVSIIPYFHFLRIRMLWLWSSTFQAE